ncbi:MAG: pilus assembly protein PilP [Gammaproteobacteria bacterium]|nr:pilus assembly protein PilP [Gammaproteobacteria bacterium]
MRYPAKREALRRLMTGMAVALLSCALVGCSDSGMSDLRDFVDNAKTKKGRVAPLPEFKPVETFAYSSGKMKDPFASWKSDAKLAAQDSGAMQSVRPDVSRRKEILENFPLDTLRMMGTFDYRDGKWGLVKAPDGIVYKVKEGNHLGQNYGKVTRIQEKDIMLTEVVPDGLGGWEEREASLGISTE